MNLRRWFQEHSLRLLAIRDTPEAIAGGVAIGIFFWFPPLLGMKTLGAILLAWLTRSNILAAVIAVTLHDVLFPVMFIIYRWEYCIGYWFLTHPHHFPRHLSKTDFSVRFHWGDWRDFWSAFKNIGRPLMFGSVVFGVPAALVSFFATRQIVRRHQRRKLAAAVPKAGAPRQ